MKQSRNLTSLAVAIICGLSLVLVPAINQALPVQASPDWVKSTVPVTLENEKYVVDAWVIRDDTAYKMWYTHGKTDLTVTKLIDSITDLSLGDIIDDLADLNLDKFLDDIGALDASDILEFIDTTSTVIGYAESSDGKSWEIKESEAFTGSGGPWSSVGNPCVIKDGSTYKMWYTHGKTDLSSTELQTLLTEAKNRDTDAILDLLDTTSTIIGYAESSDGKSWEIKESEALVGSGLVWNSVGAPCVIKDGTTYKMWYTQGKTDFTRAELDAILQDAANFDIDDLLDIIDCTNTNIAYAESTDGKSWEVKESEALGGSGSAWDSVGTPSVTLDETTYKMWYTRAETDFDKAKLHDLLDEIKGLNLGDFVDDLESGDLGELLEDIAALDLTNIRDLLTNSSAIIALASSEDGQEWTVTSSEEIKGTGGSWSSVGAPCVIKDGSTYKMWYTQGITDLTVNDLLKILDGTITAIGYAVYVPGGAGGAPPTYIETNLFGSMGHLLISRTGEILETVKVTSADGTLTITIPAGTTALDKYGNPISSLGAAIYTNPPPPPEGSYIIGLPYNFTPAGATFNPAITFEYTYDPDNLPEGVVEGELTLAYYDTSTGSWVTLDCSVNTETHTITATVNHFTIFAVIASIHLPAAFTASDLTISPTEVNVGESVTISALITNTGGLSGSHTVTLKINDIVVTTTSVTLASGASQRVTFTTTQDVAGTYVVDVNGLSGIFTVKPAPAAVFTASDLTISPTEVNVGESVTISALITNTGGLSGSHTVTLKINDIVVTTTSVTLASGASQRVTFTTTQDVAGTYVVDVNGLSGIFTVKPAPQPINWWLIGGISVGFIILVVIIVLVIRRQEF